MQRPRIFLFLLVTSLLTSPSAAQTTFLGRNSVGIPDIDWQVLATPHANVHHLPETVELARRASLYAEEAYGELERRLGLSPEKAVAFAVSASYTLPRTTNALGIRTPAGIASIAGYPQEKSVIRFDGSLPRLRSAVRLEMARGFINEKIDRAISAHSLWRLSAPPDWFVEGLAGYYASSADVRGMMLLRDAVLNSQLVPLGDLGGVTDPLYRAALGESAVEFLRELVGEEGLLHILESVWTSWSFQSVLREKTGKDYEELSTEWHYRLQKRFFPSLRSEDLPSGSSQILAAGGFNSTPVVFEKDSLQLLLFLSTRTGLPSIYVRSLQSRDPRDFGRPLIRAELSDRISLLRPWRARMSVSPSGLLAFPGKVGNAEAIQICDLLGDELRQPLLLPRFTAIGSVAWSPDGRHLALSAMDSSGRNDLYLLDVVTDSLRALTSDFFDDRDPAWSPDGQSLVFSSDRIFGAPPGREHLFLLSVADGKISQLTGGDQSDWAPSWSHDGRSILYTSDRGSLRNAYTLRVPGSGDARGGEDSGAVRRITDFALPVFDPVWTAGGDLVFSTFEGGSLCIDRLLARQVKGDSIAADAPPASESVGTLPGPGGMPVEPAWARLTSPYSSALSQASVTTTPLLGIVGGFLFTAWNAPGNGRYTLQAMSGPSASASPLSDVGLALSRTYHGRSLSAEYALYYYTGQQSTTARPDTSTTERLLGGYGLVGIPAGTFQRFELSTTIAYTRNVGRTPSGIGSYLFVSASAAYVFDNTLWGGVGPIDGRSFRLSVSLTDDILRQAVRYLSVIVDLRDYLRLGQHSALASRVWLFYNHGTNCRRFGMGGSWDLRGYAQGSLKGEKMWLLSEEIRFPLLEFLGLESAPGNLTFWRVSGALTLDFGAAWDRKYLTTDGSFGVGVRASLGQAVILRWDFGKRIENNFSTLQHGTYSIIYFGWNF